MTLIAKARQVAYVALVTLPVLSLTSFSAIAQAAESFTPSGNVHGASSAELANRNQTDSNRALSLASFNQASFNQASFNKSSESLQGSWRATDEAVMAMYTRLYAPGGSVPQSIEGDIILTFDGSDVFEVTYNNVQLTFGPETALPPFTIRGTMQLTWSTPTAGTLSFAGLSQNIEVETMGFTMPAPEVESATTTVKTEISETSLALIDMPDTIYFPLSWNRL